MRSPRPPARIASVTLSSIIALFLRWRLSSGYLQVLLPTLLIFLRINLGVPGVPLGRVIVLFRIHFLPPRLVFPAQSAMDLPQHRHTPSAPGSGRQALGNLRRGLRFFHFAEVLDLPQRNVKAETDRVIGLECHISIVSGKTAKN